MTTAWRSSASVEVSQEPGALILRICGELDSASREFVQPAILAAIPTADAVILDLGDLTFCDSSGLAMFMTAHEKAKAAGTTLTLAKPQTNLSRLLELAGMDRM